MKSDKKYIAPIIVGIVVIIAFFAYYLFFPVKSDGGRLLQGTISILLRIFVPVWVFYIAKEQRRNKIPFVLLAIAIPAITLIILGLVGDKKEKVAILEKYQVEK